MLRHGGIALGCGLVAAAAIVLLVTSQGDRNLQATSLRRPTYVTLVSQGSQARIEASPALGERVRFIAASSASDVGRVAAGQDIDGIVVDDKTIESLGEGLLSSLFADGRVIVAFDVEKQDVLRLAQSSQGFSDADLRLRPLLPDDTLNPGPPTGSYASPFFSVVFRTRPGISRIGGGETTQEYAPKIFAVLLVERAQYARGVPALP